MKLEKKKEIYGDIKELISIEKIENGNIKLNDGRKITMIKVEPANFKLKTYLEQKSILEGYKLFLKRCNFNMQILIQTQKKDLDDYIKNVKEAALKDFDLREMINDYIQFLKEISARKEIITKSFYILIETTNSNEDDIISKISESLKICDNEVKRCDSVEVVKVIRNYLNRKII